MGDSVRERLYQGIGRLGRARDYRESRSETETIGRLEREARENSRDKESLSYEDPTPQGCNFELARVDLGPDARPAQERDLRIANRRFFWI